MNEKNFYHTGTCLPQHNYRTFKLTRGDYANACLFVYSEKGVILVLKKRRNGKKQFMIPGGERNHGETNPILTAIRNFEEKVGVNNINFDNKKFVVYGKKNKNNTFTLMVIVKVDNIKDYIVIKPNINNNIVGVGILKRLPFSIFTREAENTIEHKNIKIVWCTYETDISKHVGYNDLFMNTIACLYEYNTIQ
jgi:hypothetical protein